MGDRRSGKRDGFRKHRRHPSGCQQSTVPSWEKRFCYSTCSISWGKLLEAKKLMEFYQNILQWDDSAGEEAFQNAKARFWAKINQLPCDISLPSPDIYIDEVDWDCEVDPELLKDLDQRVPSVDDDDEEEVRGTGYLTVGWDNPPPCTGWGDAEEPIQPTGWGDAEDPIQPTGWGDAEDPIQPTGWGYPEDPIQPTGWDTSIDTIQPTGWGDSPDLIQPTGWDTAIDTIQPTGWGDSQDLIQPTGWDYAEESVRPTRWGDIEDPVQQVLTPSTNFDRENKNWSRDGGINSCRWGQRENKTCSLKNVQARKNISSSTLQDWNLKSEAPNQHFSRYKDLRQQGGDDLSHNRWRNYGGRKRGTAGGDRWEVERQRQLALWQWHPIRSMQSKSYRQTEL